MLRNTKMEARPTEVAEKPKQAGEIRSRWEWTEPSVWTENMLTTPTKGDKIEYNIFDEHGLSSLNTTYFKFVNPENGLIANRRAGCGKSASPVRREGERKSMRSPYPYRKSSDVAG